MVGFEGTFAVRPAIDLNDHAVLRERDPRSRHRAERQKEVTALQNPPGRTDDRHLTPRFPSRHAEALHGGSLGEALGRRDMTATVQDGMHRPVARRRGSGDPQLLHLDEHRTKGVLDRELDAIDWIDAVDPDGPVQGVVIAGEVAKDRCRVGKINVANPYWR